MSTARVAQASLSRKSRWNRSEVISGYLFLLPNFLGFCFFTMIPIVYGFVLSFTDYTGFNKLNFVGLENYVQMFQDDNVRIALENNFTYTVFMVPATIILALAVASMINMGVRRFSNVFKTLLFLPNVTSSVAIAIVWKQMYNPTIGPINMFLRGIGIQAPPQWLASSQWAMVAVIITAVWHSLGFNMVLLLAGLQGIPKDLYDAAEVDGAVGLTKFWKITFPLLTPTIFFVLVMTTINSFKVFDLVFQMTNGGPGRATIVLVYRIYREAFTSMRFGYASAQAYLLFVIIFIFTFLQFRLQKRWVFYGD